jgi:dTDP-4-dehydrorhamnose 3,5-epimerase
MTAHPPGAIPGVSLVPLTRHVDDRGDFVKVFQASVARAAGLDPQVAELFWSRSRRGVVRGLHFQVPPAAHQKLVTIVAGRVFDVVVDLRVGSPTFGGVAVTTLDAEDPAALTIPVGCAHGFQALTDDATVLYATTTEHSPAADCGIRWDSVGAAWPLADAVVSTRDAGFPALAEFDSPFRFEALT